MENGRENVRKTARRPAALALLVVIILGSVSVLIANKVAAVAVIVPYSTTPVADGDLDGNPATGAWGDAVASTVPLENGETGAYGQATMYVKHDGTFAYFRIDGSIDVAWTSATGNRFWLGFALSTTTENHHSGGAWDGAFFGFWNGGDYSPQPTYPPPAVDTNGFDKPPAKDTVQNLLGTLRYSGTAEPFSYTAEWKRRLSTGDTNDITYVADGSMLYHFYVTTDSDGGGSSGGNIDHSRTTNSNTIRFAVVPANTPPTVDLTTPDGGELWTGATSHSIRWNMSDAETVPTSLRVWLNYSTDGGASWLPIAGAQGASGFSSPAVYAWMVPSVNSMQARARITVADAAGSTAVDSSLADFAIDSIPPTVATFIPSDGAIGVDPSTTVRATFSEAMNKPSVQSAFSLRRIDSGYYVPGILSWNVNELTFTPSIQLVQGFMYQARINASARDVSDPGNQMAGPATSSFTIADTTPPLIASATAVPSPQEIGLPVNVSAAVTDNGLLAGVWIEVWDPIGTSMGNNTAIHDTVTGRYFREQSYSSPGAYSYHVSAMDASINWAATDGVFTMVDTQPPVIQHTPISQALRNVPIKITATITDVDSVADARLDFTDVLGARTNVSMALNGTRYEYDIPGQPSIGNMTYFIWATDPSSNSARTTNFTISIIDADPVPPVIVGVTVIPPVQEVFQPVNISATVSDNIAVAGVDIDILDPVGGVVFSGSMDGGAGVYWHQAGYSMLGLFTFVVTASDSSGNKANRSGDFTIVDTQPPIANAGPDRDVGVGAVVTLDGSASTDNFAIANYTWTFTDVIPVTLFGAVTSYTFSNIGSFYMTLTVKDTSGNPGTDGAWINVSTAVSLVADAGPGQSVPQGTLVTLDGSGSTSSLGIDNYTWTFIDIIPVELWGVMVQHRFRSLANITVQLTVEDSMANEDTDTTWVNIVADTVPPVADAGPDKVIELGQSVTLDGSASTDDVYIANYSWLAVQTSQNLYGVVVSYQPNAAGVWQFVLTVMDASGLMDSDVANVTVTTIDSTPPAAPLDLEAETHGPGSIRVTWEANSEPDLAGYILYRAEQQNGPFIRLNADLLQSTAYIDSGLVPEKRYWYIVHAVDDVGTVSPPSEKADAVAGAYPAEEFAWGSIVWALVPISMAVILVFIAFLAGREGRRIRSNEEEQQPPQGPPTPPPPET